MSRISKISATLASVAALVMAATPAAAIELPTRGPAVVDDAPAVWSAESVAAERHRHRRWRHRDNGIDADDVIAGAVIIGGIAALAGAFDNDRDERRGDYRYQPSYQSDGLDRAAEMCVAEIERDVRVASVDGVDRAAGGWRVNGSLYDGGRFTCRIGNDGRISDIDYGEGGVNYTTEARGSQWDDETYAAAWSRVDGGTAPLQPAYPGGPLPGENYEGY